MARKASKAMNKVIYATSCFDDLKARKGAGGAVIANTGPRLHLSRGDGPRMAWMKRLSQTDRPPRGRCSHHFQRHTELREILSSP